MTVIDVGSGPPLVLIAGIQGRWEWMRPTVRALAEHMRVLTFSFADEPTCGGAFDGSSVMSSYVAQVAAVMDQAGLARATICGVSYGGLVAAAFAASHPSRVEALVLVSALPPSWTPDARVRFYLRWPRLLSPLFCLASLRMYREIAAAAPGLMNGVSLATGIGWTALTHLFSPSRMARRARMLGDAGGQEAGARPLLDDLARVGVPTLIVLGEDHLDRVVPTRLTREYAAIWPHARLVTLARTGHLGSITRARDFAAIVETFVREAGKTTAAAQPVSSETRRRIG